MILAATRFGAPGARPALLAHCFLGHGRAWAGLMAALETPLDALAVDLPGHGASPAPPPGDLQAQVTAALRPLVPAPALLIGHSFGATVALRFALENPGLATGLVLFEPVFFAAARDTPEYAPWLEIERPVHEALAAGRTLEAAEAFLATNGGGWAGMTPRARAAMAARMPMLSATVPGIFEDSGGQLAAGRLEGLDLPVLMLAGSASPAMFRAIPWALARRLPRAEVQEIAGAGHMLPLTHPAESARVIDAWLARTAALAA